MAQNDTILLNESVNLTCQVAIITGGGRGLGRAFALRLAAAGASIAVLARTEQEITSTVDAIREAGGVALGLSVDVSNQEAVAVGFSSIMKELGPVDILVNNAGIGVPVGPLWEIDTDAWWRMQEINLKGPVICSKAVLPSMLARNTGRIVNIASVAGLRAYTHMSPYSVSKTAIIRLSENLAQELHGHDISVFAMSPGTVRTRMTEASYSPEGRHWVPWFSEIFDEGKDVPPEHAERLLLQLVSGKYDALSGCFVHITDDLDAMVSAIAQGAEGVARLRLSTART